MFNSAHNISAGDDIISDFAPFLYPNSGTKFLHSCMPDEELHELKALQEATVAKSRPVLNLPGKSDGESSMYAVLTTTPSILSMKKRKQTVKQQEHQRITSNGNNYNSEVSALRPYVCRVCGKAFLQHGYLVVHRRAHTGERPYCCMICLKRFTQSGNLNVHMRSHEAKIKTANFCFKCNKTFLRASNYSKHLNGHINIDSSVSNKYSCNPQVLYQ